MSNLLNATVTDKAVLKEKALNFFANASLDIEAKLTEGSYTGKFMGFDTHENKWGFYLDVLFTVDEVQYKKAHKASEEMGSFRVSLQQLSQQFGLSGTISNVAEFFAPCIGKEIDITVAPYVDDKGAPRIGIDFKKAVSIVKVSAPVDGTDY